MNRALRKRFPTKSPTVRSLIRVVEKVLPTDANLMILGESGVGKDFLARVIHDLGRRSSGPFVSVDCAGIPADLFESELFGYEKGAFTDAKARKPGRIEQAEGGSIVFSEVGSLPSALQAKLLRVIQERQLYRLGGRRPVQVDARVMSTSAMKIADMVEAGTFRTDLFYRLNVVMLEIPPLRDRSGDVELLASRFLSDSAERHGKKGMRMGRETIELLRQYPWPGNVRELRNVIERAVIVETGKVIRPESLPKVGFVNESGLVREAAELGWSLSELEARYIREILRRTEGNNTRAAEILGIHRKTLIEKRKRMELHDGAETGPGNDDEV